MEWVLTIGSLVAIFAMLHVLASERERRVGEFTAAVLQAQRKAKEEK